MFFLLLPCIEKIEAVGGGYVEYLGRVWEGGGAIQTLNGIKAPSGCNTYKQFALFEAH